MSNFIGGNRDQPFLLPPDLKDWLPEDDLAHFVLAAVERVEITHFKVNARGTGDAQYHPRMMLALLIYCYANGIFSSRKIERATHRDIGVRYIAANTHPDHDTICKFRRENADAFGESFLQVLLLARELKLLKVGMVSVDGTKLDANANKHRSVRYDRARELVDQLKLDVDELISKAEQADGSGGEDPQALPKEIARREVMREKLDAACKRLEAQAKARAKKERVEYEAKLAVREKRPSGRKGGKPKPPDETPKNDEQNNLTDPDSRLMRKSEQSEFRQSYNAQAVVDADGSYLILGSRVTQCASDINELVAAVEAIPEALDTPATVLADSGYACGAEVETLQGRDIEVLVSTNEGDGRRRYDFRPPKTKKPPKEPQAEWIKAMRAKLEISENRKKYRLRRQTVEPVFGILKNVLGFRRFSLRGLAKVESEWKLLSLAYNCKRLHRMQGALVV
ncbi:MAG: IS1182 family transposase [Proteobacteria bacterium]|nr:IS1182 family transposase [Pseudomonadota bacterium]